MSTPYKDVDSNAILADIQKVAREHGPVTRVQYRKYGTFSERSIIEKFGGFFNAVQAAGSGKSAQSTPTLVETNEVSGNKWEITLPKTRIHTLPQLLEHAKVDTSIWKVDRFVVNCWEMGFKDSNDKPATQPLYQVKATLIRDVVMIDVRQEIEALKDEVKKVARVPKSVIHSAKSSGNLLELMIPDLHAGKLCWAKETGYQNYDTPIAIATYRNAVDSLLVATKGYTFDKIILGVGNDLLQSDNIQGTTYSGTKVDTDVRFRKTYRMVREMLSETVEKLRLLAPVEVKLVPGNHDTLSTFTLGDSLECRFHNYSDVLVDNGPSMHKTVEWGETFLVLTHGHEGKQADYAAWIASKYPREFGRTKFREVHVGHKHKSALDEKFGVRVRTLSSLTPPDAWHSDNNFVGNLRVAEGLVFNKERGLVAQFYHTETD
jgi:hypothetical protein